MENKYITVAYKLYTLTDGKKELLEEAPADHPFQFISGIGYTLDRFEKEIFKYLSLDRQHFPWASQLFEQPKMDRDYFMDLADRFRSPHIWKWEDGMWKLRHTPYEGDSEVLWGDPRGTHHEI